MSAGSSNTKEFVQSLFGQFSNGCGQIDCPCKWCKSSSQFPFKFNSPNEVAAKAIETLRTHSIKEVSCPFYKQETPQNVVEIKSFFESNDEKEIQTAFRMLFSDIEHFQYILQSKPSPVRKDNFQLDINSCKSLINFINNHPLAVEEAKPEFYKLLESLIAKTPESYGKIRSIVFAFCFDILLIFHSENDIVFKFLYKINKLSDQATSVLIEMFSLAPPILKNAVMICQTIISVLSHESFKSNRSLDACKYACNIINLLHHASLCSDYPLPYTAFCNEPLSKLFIQQNEISDISQYIGALSFVLKARYMYSEIMNTKEMLPHLEFQVNRNNIVEESINFLINVKPSHLIRRLSVFFTGEAGVDAGGLSREFFYLLVNSVFSPDYGMFRIIDQNTYWFVHSDFSEPMKFNVLGTLIALAISNNIILPIRFPVALYKKLNSMKMTLEDLNQIEPNIVKTLKEMRQMIANGEDVSTVCLQFNATVTVFGEPVVVELCEGGNDKDVTNENLEEYIAMTIDFFLNRHISNEFAAFQRGFRKLDELHILKYVMPDELDLIVSGLPTRDWNIFKKGARYDNGYTQTSEQIVWFWKIFDSLSEEDKAALMQFITGTDRTPVASARTPSLVIRRSPDVKTLPEAHTCLNLLMLPQYPSEQIMREKLMFAVKNSEGFNLL